jgi:hypothetical protein
MNEIKKRKPGSGGKREGSGRKLKAGESKEPVTIRLYPKQQLSLTKQYGSVQKAVDSLPWADNLDK